MARSRAWLLNLGLAAVSTACGLGGVELLARLYAHSLEGRPHTTRGSIIRYSPTLGWDKPPGASAWLLRPEYEVLLRVNAHGLRGPDGSYEKPPGTRRVLLLGDSFTEGYTVAEADTVRAALERALAPRCGAVEVLNAGTIGYSTDQEYLFYLDEGRRYQPDIVVMLFFYNDLYENTTGAGGKPYFELEAGRLALRNSPPPPPKGGLERRPEPRLFSLPPLHGSIALRLLSMRTAAGSPRLHAWLARFGIVDPVRVRVLPHFWPLGPGHKQEVADMWQRMAAILAALRQAVEADGARLLLFAIPEQAEVDDRAWALTRQKYALGPSWSWDKLNRRLRATCDATGVPLLAPLLAYREAAQRDGPAYFAEDGHWNERGHALAAREIAQVLQEPRFMACPR